MAKRVLIIDDEHDIREALSLFLGGEGFVTTTAASGEEALEYLREHDADILITDIRMPGIDGMEVLRRVRDWYPRMAVVLMTAYASVETAIQAMRAGAADYVIKPVDFDELLLRLRRLVKHTELQIENTLLRQRLHEDVRFENIIGRSRQMIDVFDLIRKVAATRSNVLIQGKSGTGKELVAKAIHYNSERREKIYLPINCGAISETLIESELFGHKRGAFTDAFQDKQGVFQLADGGTLFLDEVAEIPMHLQVKLLRALDEREFTPVGGSTPVRVDVRIISATNQDLQAMVAGGTFREDLYYRLNVVEIRLPDLAERKDDIPLLVAHFVSKYAADMGKVINGVDNETMRLLMAHAWRGGVRELENVIERAVIFCDGSHITRAELPPILSSAPVGPDTPDDLREAMRMFERRHILDVMHRCAYNKESAAKSLGIGLSSLYRKIDELAITTDEIKP
jgi:DNA-binding NtrC family response regulator